MFGLCWCYVGCVYVDVVLGMFGGERGVGVVVFFG